MLIINTSIYAPGIGIGEVTRRVYYNIHTPYMLHMQYILYLLLQVPFIRAGRVNAFKARTRARGSCGHPITSAFHIMYVQRRLCASVSGARTRCS